jgi:ELWxxDGT repeat protein
MVKNIRADGVSQLGSSPEELTNVNGILFFSANGSGGRELYKSDGTEAGTVLVKEINTVWNADPKYLVNANGTLFFSATTADNGTELWKSDGTEAGTVLVKDIYPGTTGSSPSFLINVNGIVFFRAKNEANGIELWKSDGTEAGTVLVKDIYPGVENGADPGYLNFPAAIGNNLYFVGKSSSVNMELWKSDGTEAGTVLLDEIYPGLVGSRPNYLTVVGNTLFFIGTDATHSTELWKLNTAASICSPTSSWTGNSSTVWEDASNWSSGVPCATTVVTIPPGRPRYPVINVNSSVKSITIATGTSITVEAGVNLMVIGN